MEGLTGGLRPRSEGLSLAEAAVDERCLVEGEDEEEVVRFDGWVRCCGG